MNTLPDILNHVLKLLDKSDNPVEKITGSSCYYTPLSLMYDQLVKAKEIKGITELPSDQKQRYWNQVKNINVPRFTKIAMVQALYLFELIKEK